MSSSVLMKRTAWTVEDSVATVRLAVEHHDRYMVGADYCTSVCLSVRPSSWSFLHICT